MQERLIRLPEVLEIIGLSRATLYRLVGRGEFPQPIRQGRTSAWSSAEVQDYLDSLKLQRA